MTLVTTSNYEINPSRGIVGWLLNKKYDNYGRNSLNHGGVISRVEFCDHGHFCLVSQLYFLWGKIENKSFARHQACGTKNKEICWICYE